MSIIDEAYEAIDKLEVQLGEDDDNIAELNYDISQAISDVKSVKSRANALLEELERNG